MAADDLVAHYQRLQRESQAIERQLLLVEQVVEDLQRARESLDGIAGTTPLEVLVPIGGGIHMTATVDPAAPVLVSLGADVLTLEDSAVARSRIDARLSQVSADHASLAARADGVAAEAAQVATHLQATETSP